MFSTIQRIINRSNIGSEMIEKQICWYHSHPTISLPPQQLKQHSQLRLTSWPFSLLTVSAVPSSTVNKYITSFMLINNAKTKRFRTLLVTFRFLSTLNHQTTSFNLSCTYTQNWPPKGSDLFVLQTGLSPLHDPSNTMFCSFSFSSKG